MLYHLLVPLASEHGAFNVFRYITFRTGAATLTALFLAFLLAPPLIRVLSRLRVAQPIREIGPDHQAKAGTPTMGGLLILLSLAVSVLLWSELDNRLVWIALGVTLTMLTVGVICVGVTLWEGLGVWGVNQPVSWGFDIVNFVFWVGIGHAGTLISAILFLMRQRWRTGIARFAEAMTIFAVMCAGLFPLLHTGRQWLPLYSRFVGA